jgi:ribose 5-phosphate isomerase
METVTISANINEKKKAEFFQTMESLTGLVENQCNDLDIRVKDDNNLIIKITFDGKDQMEKNFYNNEFNILKGSVKSLCENVVIKVNESLLNNN